MSLFDVSDEIYPQLVCLFSANFEKVEPQGRAITYCTTKVKDTTVTFTTTFIDRIFNLNLDPSKFSRSMSSVKAHKICLQKYAHLSKLRKPTSPTQLCTLTYGSYTIFWLGPSILKAPYHIMEGYSIDFAELILVYMTNVNNLSRNYSEIMRRKLNYF